MIRNYKSKLLFRKNYDFFEIFEIIYEKKFKRSLHITSDSQKNFSNQSIGFSIPVNFIYPLAVEFPIECREG